MRFLSLFSGIEAASVAWAPLGWECAAVAEIDKFPCALLKHHYPRVPNLGDVTKITADQVEALGRLDLVVFGFPCQDLSVAGKRTGLKGERSGLFFDAMRIVRWSGARFALAENVPGLFSSNDGRDFSAVVGEMAGVQPDVPDGGWANSGFLLGPDALVEWAVLDAQFFGVPQRRRRVFIVRDSGDWASRPPLLLERHSLSGHPAPRRKTGQVAPTVPARSLGGGGLGTDFDCDGGLIAFNARQDPDVWSDRTGPLDTDGTTQAVAFNLRRREGGAMPEADHLASMRAASGGSSHSYVAQMQVRRLSPIECERLQGFPDNYTKIDAKTADGPRYKALGNSFAVPVVRWIGERIQMVEDLGK